MQIESQSWSTITGAFLSRPFIGPAEHDTFRSQISVAKSKFEITPFLCRTVANPWPGRNHVDGTSPSRGFQIARWKNNRSALFGHVDCILNPRLLHTR